MREIDRFADRHVTESRIGLVPLSPTGRRDLANALLGAAWDAVFEETRILLLDLVIEADDLSLGEAA